MDSREDEYKSNFQENGEDDDDGDDSNGGNVQEANPGKTEDLEGNTDCCIPEQSESPKNHGSQGSNFENSPESHPPNNVEQISDDELGLSNSSHQAPQSFNVRSDARPNRHPRTLSLAERYANTKKPELCPWPAFGLTTKEATGAVSSKNEPDADDTKK